MPGRVIQVSISAGGVPKLPVLEAEVTELGLAGDGHDDRENHGGLERALCLFSLERILEMAREGHAVGPGVTGENITIEGLDWDEVVPGRTLRLGDVLAVVTRYTTPCWKNAGWFKGGDFNRMHQNLNPGWSRVYARVIHTGTIRPGDMAELIG